VRVNKWLLPTLALALLLGTVGAAQAAGWWLVSGREMVDLDHLAGGADVKGWMTLQQVADGSGIATATLYTRLGLSADILPETPRKDLEGVVEGFETSTVRTVVDEALGLAPAGGAEEPSAATPVAEGTAEATPAPTAMPTSTAVPDPTAADAHTPAGTGSGEGAGEGAGEGTGEGEARPAVTGAADIKGSHTLQEIVDATGVDMAALLAALNLPPGTDPHTALRALVAAGLLGEVDEVRLAVAELQ
jgi:hypothetical protein